MSDTTYHFEALPGSELPRNLENTITSRRANCVVLYGSPTTRGSYQVFVGGRDCGFARTEREAFDLLNRINGPTHDFEADW